MKGMNNSMSLQKRESGFTLIEIAIVLVIIGLLLGGVLQGQQLIENSRVKSATNTMNGIAAAAFSYQDRYGRMPGDDGPTATLAARGGNWGGTNITGGNTNGILNSTAANQVHITAAYRLKYSIRLRWHLSTFYMEWS